MFQTYNSRNVVKFIIENLCLIMQSLSENREMENYIIYLIIIIIKSKFKNLVAN